MESTEHTAILRPNNSARAAYRTKCRRKLSEHICKVLINSKLLILNYIATKLGISVAPVEVRLITSADDLYTWQILPEKKYLFKKQLSKLSIGAYRELCRGVGISFEAIARATAESQSLEGSTTLPFRSNATNKMTSISMIPILALLQ